MQISIINLELNLDRRKWMCKQFDNSLNVPFTFFNAVEGKLLEKNQLNEIGFKISKSHPEITHIANSGEIGCYLSHVNLYKAISEMDSDSQWFLILEDDVMISEELKILLKDPRIDQILNRSKFDIITIGYDSGINMDYKSKSRQYYHSKYRISKGLNIGYPRFHHYGSFGYFLKKSAAKKLYNYCNTNPSLADYMLYNSPKAGLKLGILNKPIVFPNFEFNSDIREEHSFVSHKGTNQELSKFNLKKYFSELLKKPKYEYLK
jgi:glycosyl transferase family 25